MGSGIHFEGKGCFGTLYPLATFPVCLIISALLFKPTFSSLAIYSTNDPAGCLPNVSQTIDCAGNW